MSQKILTTLLIGSAITVGAVGTVLIAAADALPGAVSGLAERYNTTSIPSRSDLMDQIPSLPTQFPLDPTTARQQGARELQAINPNQAMNPDTISEQLNRMNAESANPGGISQRLPSSIPSLGSGVLNTQVTNGSSGTSASNATNSPSDRLGTDPAAAAAMQSDVTRSGTLPNGALNVSGGDPLSLANTLSSLASTDVQNAYTNYLSSLLASKLQVLNTQTARLAAKIDTVNEDHAALNRKVNDLVNTMNGVLIQLPTIPQS